MPPSPFAHATFHVLFSAVLAYCIVCEKATFMTGKGGIGTKVIATPFHIHMFMSCLLLLGFDQLPHAEWRAELTTAFMEYIQQMNDGANGCFNGKIHP